METILDHNPTSEELSQIFHLVSQEDVDRYRAAVAGSDTALAHIAVLHMIRGKPDLAAHYIASIKDPAYRFGVQQVLIHQDVIPSS